MPHKVRTVELSLATFSELLEALPAEFSFTQPNSKKPNRVLWAGGYLRTDEMTEIVFVPKIELTDSHKK